MMKRLYMLAFCFFGFISENTAQHLYYKYPDREVVTQFNDTAHRVVLVGIDSNNILRKQFEYILKFHPTLRVKKIYVYYNTSEKIVNTKPKFASVFKAPLEQEYKVYFSKKTNSTLDSVILQNLSFNAQLGLIANQISQIEDLTTGGYFDYLAWNFRKLYRKGRNKTYLSNEEKTLEVGLGWQLLSLNRELEENLKIERWLNTKGYTHYAKQMRNQAMKPEMILNFINDLPVYVGKVYK